MAHFKVCLKILSLGENKVIHTHLRKGCDVKSGTTETFFLGNWPAYISKIQFSILRYLKAIEKKCRSKQYTVADIGVSVAFPQVLHYSPLVSIAQG